MWSPRPAVPGSRPAPTPSPGTAAPTAWTPPPPTSSCRTAGCGPAGSTAAATWRPGRPPMWPALSLDPATVRKIPRPSSTSRPPAPPCRFTAARSRPPSTRCGRAGATAGSRLCAPATKAAAAGWFWRVRPPWWTVDADDACWPMSSTSSSAGPASRRPATCASRARPACGRRRSRKTGIAGESRGTRRGPRWTGARCGRAGSTSARAPTRSWRPGKCRPGRGGGASPPTPCAWPGPRTRWRPSAP